MSGNWIAVLVFIVTLALFHQFSVYDWGYGIVRGFLLLILALLLLFLHFFLNRLRFSSERLLRYLLLVLIGVAVLFNLSLGVRTMGRTNETHRIEFDQGQMSYRAVKYLLAGINPYGQYSLVDPVVYQLFINKYQHRTECSEYQLQTLVSNFTAFWERPGGSAEGMEAFFPSVSADNSCRDVKRAFTSLGYPYGPVTIVSYAPFVLLFEESGVYVNHLLLVGVLAAILFWIGRRMTKGSTILALLPCLLVLITPFFRQNFLDLSASDLSAVVFALGFLALWMRGKYDFAAAALALSVGSKFLPGLLFVPLLVKSPIRMGFWMVFVLTAVFSPFVLWDATGLLNSLSVASISSTTDSTSLVHFMSPATALALKATFFAGLIAVIIWCTRNGWTNIVALRYLAFAHIGLLLIAPLIHNNYLTWLLPVFGLAVISEIYTNKRARLKL